MNSTSYQTTDYFAARSQADDSGRVATTITLIAVATCMVLAKSFAAQHPPAVQRSEVAAVRIVDPDFCKNQTWPYIDTRCLKRVAPDQPVAENHPENVPANPQVSPSPAPAAPLATAINSTPASGSLSASYTSDTTGGAVHSTPPTAVVNGAERNDSSETIALNTVAIATDNSGNARVADSHHSRRSQHWQHGAFFGFRF